MDLIAAADRLPGLGQSVLGTRFDAAPGGKAANQAAQIARCGGQARLISRLGRDPFGVAVRAALAEAGVDLAHVAVDADRATGASTVFAAEGDYASIIVAGAAGAVSAEDVVAADEALTNAAALLLQLETGQAAAVAAARRAAAAGAEVILNASPDPGPWSALPADLRQAVSVLVVNRWEATALLGEAAPEPAPADLAAQLAAATGARAVLLTLGADGAVFRRDGAAWRQSAYETDLVDAVGAGDAFLGAFVAAWLRAGDVSGALQRGAAAGALAVSRRGAFLAQPTAAEIDAFLRRMDPETAGA